MIQQSQFLSQPLQIPSILTQSPYNKKFNVYFTYQSSPQPPIQQNLKVIKQQQEEKKRKRIFEPRRKFSFQQLSTSKKRLSRLKIFQQQRNRISTMNQPLRIEEKKSQIFARFNSGDLQKSINIDNDKILRTNSSNVALGQYLSTACYQKSPIYLKQSIISGAQTIVDQLDDLVENNELKNPINRKLLGIKNRQTKRTFYSNPVNDTMKNSLMFGNEKDKMIKRNRIDSEVMNYQYSPNNKYRSSVTIKATNRPYGTSKFSNRLSIITNDNNPNQQLFEDFQDKENIQTPKYNKSTYRSMMRKSFQPSMKSEKQNVNQKQQSMRKNSFLEVKNHVQTDRFYDESSLQTPRLPIITKKISYEVIDPLTNSLKKQKMEKKQLRKLSQITEVKQPLQQKQSKLKQFFVTILSASTKLSSTTSTTVAKYKQNCFDFLRSELFFLIIIVLLSLTIFGIQLLQ